ncbi:MAG: trypsin-like peptidase domain-containing protein [Deltaproteobacteria bacterium]|nr:trypsin-like peptidase domain-containing protein [Deltaproteobacteria bacterium]
MRRLSVLASLALLAGCTTAETKPEAPLARTSRRTTVKQVLKSSVRVHVLDGTEVRRAATGVVVEVIDSGGHPTSYVVTNEHVVEKADLKQVTYQVLVDGPKGATAYPATLLAEGAVPSVDLAVLTVPGVRLDAATLASDDELAVGDDVVVVGAPYGRGLTVCGGMLSMVEVGDGRPTQLKTDAPVGYGASGGGLFSVETGHLLGVVEGYRTAQVQVPGEGGGYTFDVPMPGETFAASVAKLRRFLEEKCPRRESIAVSN